MEKSKVIFDGRLKEDYFPMLKECIGKKLVSIHFEKVSIVIKPNLSISAIGRCCLRFYGNTNKEPIINISFKSQYFHEMSIPISSRSTLECKGSLTNWKPLKDKMLELSPDIPEIFTGSLSYPEESLITSIKFYGFHEHGNLKIINSDLELEDIKSFGFGEFPDIEVDSIELIDIEHENGFRTILILQNDGFGIELLTSVSIEELLVRYFGSSSNIILQKEIM